MRNDTKCSICNNQLSIYRYKTMSQWDIQGYLCGNCYSKELLAYYNPAYVAAKVDNSPKKTLNKYP